MKYGPLVYLGIFLALATSWCGLIFAPYSQLADMGAVKVPPTNQIYPTAEPGRAVQGAEVYRENGCFYCHTQQVRRWGAGLDEAGAEIARQWGPRHSVAQDYLYDQPVMLGDLRIGPDLANIGTRQTNAVWHLLHLYEPKITVPNSTMPPSPFLFEKRRIRGSRSADALELPERFAVEPGYEVVPKPEAHALVSYLLNLDKQAEFFPEASWPREQKPAAEAPTEGGADTNSPPAQ